MGFWIYMPQLVAFFLMCDTLSLLNVPRALNQKNGVSQICTTTLRRAMRDTAISCVDSVRAASAQAWADRHRPAQKQKRPARWSRPCGGGTLVRRPGIGIRQRPIAALVVRLVGRVRFFLQVGLRRPLVLLRLAALRYCRSEALLLQEVLQLLLQLSHALLQRCQRLRRYQLLRLLLRLRLRQRRRRL